MIRSVLSTTGAALLLATSAYAQEPPPLRAAVDGTFAPHAFPSLTGGYQGFNVDLANEIAKRLKRNIIIDAAQFSGLVPALQAGTYDFLAAPTTVTKERAENMLFTEGYLNTDFQFLIRKGTPKVNNMFSPAPGARARGCGPRGRAGPAAPSRVAAPPRRRAARAAGRGGAPATAAQRSAR